MARVSKRFCIIASGVATLIALILIGLSLFVLITYESTSITATGNKTSNDSFISFTEGLIYTTNNNEIWAWDIPANTTHALVTNQSEPIHSFDYYGNRTVYYSAPGYSNPIVSASPDYKNFQYPGVGSVASALSVDSLGGNVYVYDSKGGKIDVFNVKNERHGIRMTDQEEVMDIALDPYRSLIFLLHSKSISMAKSDGTKLEIIIKEDQGYISAFTLDLANDMVYWSTSTHISRYNYIDKKSLVIASVDCEVTSLGILGASLFYTCQSKTITNLFQCSVINESCKDVKRFNLNDVQKIRTYGPEYLPESTSTCSKDNGGCEHFCLPSGAKHTCACAVGWKLNVNDGSSCEPVNEYLVYLKNNYVRGQVLDQTIFSEAIVPQPTRLMAFQAKSIVEIDYDAYRKYVIFSDDHGIYRMDLNSNDTSPIQLNYNEEFIILSPVVDWIGNQIYYLRYNTAEKSYSLMVQKADRITDTKNQRELYKFGSSVRPNALILAQHRGFIFCIMYDENRGKTDLHQLTTTGQDLSRFTIEDYMSDVALAIDYAGDRFFWFNEKRTQVHTNLVNGTIASFDVSMIENPKRISIYGSTIYISSSQETHYINKLDGTYGGQLLSSATTSDSWLSAAKVFSEQQQPMYADHPCVKDNGGCTRYCFGVPNGQSGLTRECACNDNEKLEQNGVTCTIQAGIFD